MYSQHGNKGYGPLLWQKFIEYIAAKYPLVKIITLQALPLRTRKNALTYEKLCKFYTNLNAQQIYEDDEPTSYFYYDLTNQKKEIP